MVMRATIGLLAESVIAFVIAYAGLVTAGYKPVAVYSGSMTSTIGVTPGGPEMVNVYLPV